MLYCNAAVTNGTPMQAFKCMKPSSTAVLHQDLLQGSANASVCMRQATFNVAPIWRTFQRKSRFSVYVVTVVTFSSFGRKIYRTLLCIGYKSLDDPLANVSAISICSQFKGWLMNWNQLFAILIVLATQYILPCSWITRVHVTGHPTFGTPSFPRK